MKKAYFLAVLLGVAAWVDADAQVTQRFPNVVAFGTNVFLHDAPTVPLHERVPTGTVVVALTSTNGSVTINDLGSGNIDLAAVGGSVTGNVVYNNTGTNLVLVTGGGLVSSAATGTLQIGVSYNATNRIESGAHGAVQILAENTPSGSSPRENVIATNALGSMQVVNNIKGTVVQRGRLAKQAAYSVSSIGITNTGWVSHQAVMTSGQTKTGNISLSGDVAQQYVYTKHNTLIDQGGVGSVVIAAIDWTGSSASYFTITNYGEGAVQILSADSPVPSSPTNAYTSADGDGSLMIGWGVITHREALTVGSGAISYTNGSVSAIGGFWGDGPGITGLNAANLTNVAAAGILQTTVANTNYWRRTTAVPTNSAFAGTDGQRTLVWLSSTHAVERVYSGVSNLWLQSGTFYTFP